MRILIVEDERKVGQFIERSLTEAAYLAKSVRNCTAAREAMLEYSFDAIILDLGLPDGDGLRLLKEWRDSGANTPVLILSARDSMGDRVEGLNLGADDYLPKPFGLQELLARLRSLLRRHSGAKSTVFNHRGVKMDLVAGAVAVDGQRVDLTAREYALLELFMQHKGRVLTRKLITESIWESHSDLDANLLDVYMGRLRKKLELTPEKKLFRTLRGIGYEMI